MQFCFFWSWHRFSLKTNLFYAGLNHLSVLKGSCCLTPCSRQEKRSYLSLFPNPVLLPGVATPLTEAGNSLCCQLSPSGTDTERKVAPVRLHHAVPRDDVHLLMNSPASLSRTESWGWEKKCENVILEILEKFLVLWRFIHDKKKQTLMSLFMIGEKQPITTISTSRFYFHNLIYFSFVYNIWSILFYNCCDEICYYCA